MRFVAIGVRVDNIMYLVYDDGYAISIDSYDPRIIEESLSCEFSKEFYKSEEINKIKEKTKKRKLIATLTTHSHFDHSNGDSFLKNLYPDIRQISGFYKERCFDGQKIQLRKIKIECIETKCHTQDSFCFYVNDKWLFTGDTVFFLGCGYFNDGTGSQMAEAFEKIKNRVDKKTLMLYGHDYRKGDTSFIKNIPKEILRSYDIPKHLEEKMFLFLEDEIKYNPFFRVLEEKGNKGENISKLRQAKNQFNKK
ncbi:putative hydroxyacylglutathione hydrolase [Nosema granulosis]|uniref:Hydroxyacylglutathione hydrolase n=1 Tax=Nosema granulosis TaxID=83296 RepID=A0A9P6GW39_9MICR|nr:putative hydroxyacylglutathione hydrolase [Nosema granulosis]